MPDFNALLSQQDSLQIQLAQAIETKNHDRLPLIAAAIAQANAQLRAAFEGASTNDELPDTTDTN